MIELRNIGKVYQTKGVRTCGVQNLSLSIEEGEFVMILGRSGCGKSTLLNILGGIDRPTQGEYLFRGTPVSRLKGKELAAFRNKHIGYIFQGYCLVEELDALHNVELPLGYAGVSARNRRSRARQALEQVGLADRMKHYPSQLSGG